MLQLLGKNVIIQITDLAVVPRQFIVARGSFTYCRSFHLLDESGFIEDFRVMLKFFLEKIMLSPGEGLG